MSVMVRFGNRKAILCQARWQAADTALETMLNEATQQWLAETGGPPLGDADPDFTTALTVGIAHGGRIHRNIPSRRPITRQVYMKARQIPLF
jgi:hypothetical protein